MKKIFLLTILLFQLTFVFGQTNQWGSWSPVSCYSRLSTSVLGNGYVPSIKEYSWQIRIKSTYSKKVTFNMTWIVGGERLSIGQVTLSPNESYGHTPRYFKSSSNNIVVEVSEVCFEGQDCYKYGYSDCNGNQAKITNNSSSTNSTNQTNNSNQQTVQQNDLSEYNRSKANLEKQVLEENNRRQQQATQLNNQKQQFINVYNEGVQLGNTGRYSEAVEKYQRAIGLATNETDRQTAQNAYNRISKANNQTQALNQISSSLTNLARAFDDAKEEKRQKREQERLAQEQLQREGEQQAALASEEMERQWKIANGYSDLESIEGYEKAIQIMLPYATDNRLNGMALNTIGFWYWKLEDYKNAKLWYSKAYDKNNATASRNLGVLYLNGMGVDKNKKEAIYYFQEACDKGIEEACKEYKNIRTELEIFNEKSENKNFGDLCSLAESYMKEKDYSTCYAFYCEAYRINTSSGWKIPYNIADISMDVNKLNNKELATFWFEKTIKEMEKEKTIQQKNNTSSTFTDYKYVSTLLIYGSLIKEKDGKLAIDVFLKAVRNKPSGKYSKYDNSIYIGAYTEIGIVYELGKGGIEKDWKQAQYYYEMDAERQSAKAMNYLGKLFEKGGPNLEESKSNSNKWYKLACKTDMSYCK